MHTTMPMPSRYGDLNPRHANADTVPASNVYAWESGASACADPDAERVRLKVGVPLDRHVHFQDAASSNRSPRQVGVQVIADADGLAHGYELLYRRAGHKDARGIVNGKQATCEVLATAVLDLGLPRRLRGLCFYVNVDQETLMSQVVEVIRPAWGVVELLESIVASQEVVARIRQLKEIGLRFALDDVVSLDDSRWALIDQVELIKIDWRSVRQQDILPMLARAKAHGVKVLAEKIESESEKALACALGIDLMQGHAIARPDVLVAPSMPPTSALALRRAWLLLQHGPTNEAVAMAMASDPATALRIWQVAELDGASAGTQERPHRLADLVADLSRPLLQAWLSVLQVVDSAQIDRSWTYAGLVQSRLMRVLARRVAPDNLGLADEAFLLGLVDHFRTTLGIAYRDPDLGVRAGQNIERALRERNGVLGAILEFAQGHFRQPTGWLPGPLTTMPGLAQSLSSIYREAHLWARERSLDATHLNPASIKSTWPETVRRSTTEVWNQRSTRVRRVP